MSGKDDPQQMVLGLPALVRLLCILPLVAVLWCGVYWAMG